MLPVPTRFMLELVVLLALIITLVAAGAFFWRLARGRARRSFGAALRLAILTLLLTPLVLYSAWQISKARTFQIFGEVVPRVHTTEPLVALTFDDGPTPQLTEEILTILREKGVRATFFVTGAELERNMTEGAQIVAAGHELGNHSYSHMRMLGCSYSFVRDEIERTDELIHRAGYSGPVHFRSPYGKRFLTLPLYLSRTGRRNIFWDVEPESYNDVATDADRITEHVLQHARPGSIILLHVMYAGRAPSMRAVPRIIDGLRARGYRFVTISELLAAGTPA